MSREEASVRYGRGTLGKKYLGDPVSNSACSRVYQGCRARKCRLQSPNFPGMYPRNVTCYYLVKALPSPSHDLLPLITISQGNDRLLHIGHQGHGSRVSPESRLRLDAMCRDLGDFIEVHDGGSMSSPLLARICGTAILPNITSSGPEMLVVFQSAPSGMMNRFPNLVSGFELEARVLYMKKDPVNSINSAQCAETIQSFGRTSGVVVSPVFALPVNTSCSYVFQGRRDEVVWLYFTKYRRTQRKEAMMNYISCRNRLALYDGNWMLKSDSKESVRLIGDFCDDQQPPLCIRSRQKGTVSRPCMRSESFLSTGPSMSIRQVFTDRTALLPLEYVIHYEFVTLTEPGTDPGSDCDRVVTSALNLKGHLNSPKNLFLYGRVGKSSLTCMYTFKTLPGEGITLKIRSLGFGGNMCKTVHNFQSNLYECIAHLPGSAVLEVWEEPWNNTRLPLGCVCDSRVAPTTFSSRAPLVQLKFAIRDMSWSHDFNDFYFDAEYKFFSARECRDERILNGSTGSILIQDDVDSRECYEYPWKIVASAHRHLYLNLPGYLASSLNCSTENRVVVYGSHTARPIKAVCPETGVSDSVHVFSSGWNTALDFTEPRPDSLIIRYLSRKPAKYKFTWLEVRREPRPSALESLKSVPGGVGHKTLVTASSCPYQCPDLDACISPLLWCDGVEHCPSGADELPTTCFYSTVPWLYVILGAVATVSLLVLTSTLVALRIYHRGKVKRKKKKETQQIMTREVILPLNFHKEEIY